MTTRVLFFFLASASLTFLPCESRADAYRAPGALVGVSIEVDGRGTPLYASPDGSPRRYFEARRGSSYSIRIENRTAQRLGVVITVDGLNAITGIQAASPASWGAPGRMYVLDPWGGTEIRGWRTSLDETRRFTFVDETVSYAARTGQANPKLGWVELAVYRERRPYVRRPWFPIEPRVRSEAGKEAQASGNAEAPEASPEASAPENGARTAAPLRGDSTGAPPSGYPGTGWGDRDDDPAQVVSFEPETAPAETVTLRYEYARGLRALGILPQPDCCRDRLGERERGGWGFAPPPAW